MLNGQSLITTQDKPRAVILELQKASEHLSTDDLVFLGLQDGAPVFSAACKESITEHVDSGTEVCLEPLLLLALSLAWLWRSILSQQRPGGLCYVERVC